MKTLFLSLISCLLLVNTAFAVTPEEGKQSDDRIKSINEQLAKTPKKCDVAGIDNTVTDVAKIAKAIVVSHAGVMTLNDLANGQLNMEDVQKSIAEIKAATESLEKMAASQADLSSQAKSASPLKVPNATKAVSWITSVSSASLNEAMFQMKILVELAQKLK